MSSWSKCTKVCLMLVGPRVCVKIEHVVASPCWCNCSDSVTVSESENDLGYYCTDSGWEPRGSSAVQNKILVTLFYIPAPCFFSALALHTHWIKQVKFAVFLYFLFFLPSHQLSVFLIRRHLIQIKKSEGHPYYYTDTLLQWHWLIREYVMWCCYSWVEGCVWVDVWVGGKVEEPFNQSSAWCDSGLCGVCALCQVSNEGLSIGLDKLDATLAWFVIVCLSFCLKRVTKISNPDRFQNH